MILALLLSCAPGPTVTDDDGIVWTEWGDGLFERAEREQRLVVLHLGTAWCHWCHVMDETTYRDPAVLEAIEASYLPVRADAEEQLELATRYEDYGWPATVIFAADGTELAKLRGYKGPERYAALLEAFAADPTPGPSIGPEAPPPRWSEATTLSNADHTELLARVDAAWDVVEGGWGNVHKYLDPDLTEWSMVAGRPDRAREVLDKQRRWLHDPVWGGVYQYSDSGRWDSPHFEKLMAFQASNLRIYAGAHAIWPDAGYDRATSQIALYLDGFLLDDSGAFYASQDADVVRGQHSADYFALDDAARRAQGLPRVDASIYASANGAAIEGLVAHHQSTGDPVALDRAVAAAERIVSTHRLADGRFAHVEGGEGRYLADALAMGRAALVLHRETGEARWLDLASNTLDAIDVYFRAPQGPGYAASAPTATVPATRQLDENVSLARFALLLAHHTGEARHQAVAEHARRFLFTPEIARSRRVAVGGLLLADWEAGRDPVKVTVLGSEADTAALEAAALAQLPWYALVERQPADTGLAWLCVDGACSAPTSDPGELADSLRRSLQLRHATVDDVHSPADELASPR